MATIRGPENGHVVRPLCRTTPDSDGMPDADVPSERCSYSLALEEYLQIGVLTDMNKRYFTNIFAATAARAVGESSDSEASCASDDDLQPKPIHVASLELIEKR